MNCQDEDTQHPDNDAMCLLRRILASPIDMPSGDAPSSTPQHVQLCDGATFHNRLQQAMYRADRLEQQLVLVLIQVTDTRSEQDATPMILQRIGGSLRKSDSLLKLVGNRFAVLLDGIRDPDTLHLAVEKILHALDPALMSGARPPRLDLRIGASVFPEDGCLPGPLWKAAQHALDNSTGRGTDRIRFANMQQYHKSRERLELCGSLYQGFRNREFSIAYQPVVDTLNGRVLSVEMLLRWQHPRRGQYAPTRFLPLLDETGLIIPVGEWLLEQALRHSGQLRKTGHRDLRLSVNLSLRQWFDPELAGRLVRLIQDHGLDPRDLELECPATTLMRDLVASRKVAGQLADLGIRVIIDRFDGNNHALAELMRLPLAGLKIDRGLVRRLPFDPTSKAIIGGILAFADCMGISACACGVENAGQLRFLRERACPRVQGNHIARPMSHADLDHWLPG